MHTAHSCVKCLQVHHMSEGTAAVYGKGKSLSAPNVSPGMRKVTYVSVSMPMQKFL